MLQVDPSSVAKWIDRGVLLAFRTPGGHRRVRAADLVQLLEAHRMPIPRELGAVRVRVLALVGEGAGRRLGEVLAGEGTLELVLSSSPVEVLLNLGDEAFDGLIIDLELPGVDALDLVRRIRAREKLERLKIAFISSRWTDASRTEARRNRVFDQLDAGALSAESVARVFVPAA